MKGVGEAEFAGILLSTPDKFLLLIFCFTLQFLYFISS